MFNNLNITRDNSISLKYHLIFWTSYFFINFVRWGSYFSDYLYSFKSNLVEFFIHIPLTYLHIYVFIPLLILNKKIVGYFFALLSALALAYILRTELNFLLVTSNIWPEAIGDHKAYSFNHIVAVTIGEIYVIALATAIKLTTDWISERKKNTLLKQLQLKTELQYLKSQIQPHFFFNTLNNLYYLTIEKSEKASDVVLKLSEIMQYVLYDVKEVDIKLLKEINYIQSYIELEQLRHGDKITPEIEIKGDLDGINIPPLLLLPFIENCFKHGSKDTEKVFLKIYFENENNNYLIFKTTNSVNHQVQKGRTHGIGIENVRRRLELLYKNQYTLETNIVNKTFCVFLKIPII